MKSRPVTPVLLSVVTLLAGAVTVLGGWLPAGAATAMQSPAARHPAQVVLPALVSQRPVNYTPDVSGGGTCGSACGDPTVWATTVVNGEVVAAGEFGTVCSPAPGATYAPCPATVDAHFVFAFNPVTGAIDPGFTPVITSGPVYALAAGPGDSVYLGGAFTSVNATASDGVAQLYVTPGQPTDGQLVPGFDGQITDGQVTTLTYDGANALYAGGDFNKADGANHIGLTRLNATTGAADGTFKFTFADPVKGQSLSAKSLAVSPDGDTLVIAGTFRRIDGHSVSRLALIDTGGGLGQTATLENWSAPGLASRCSHQTSYVNDVTFSPDGSYFVIADTGSKTAGGEAFCDAAARFDIGTSGNEVQPAWVNYTGGNTLHAVAIAGNVVYLGGHNRWANNECGLDDACEANTVLVNGLTALDASTGMVLPFWHPQSNRGIGWPSVSVLPAGLQPGFDGGLLIGGDASSVAGSTHEGLAFLPETTTTAPAPGGAIQSGMFSDGRIGSQESGGPGSGIAAECIDDSGDSSTSGNPVELITCDNANEQSWTLAPDQAIEVNGLCLDTSGEGQASGTALVVSTCNGGAAQQWEQQPGDTVLNVGSGLCLDDPGDVTTSGTALDIAACDGAAGQVWPLPVAQAPPPPPAIGPLWSAQNQADSDVPCAEKDGTEIEIQACDGQATANWTLESNGTLRDGGDCLDTQGEATTAATPVVVATCNHSATQDWTAKANQTLVQQGSGLCLHAPATANGTQLEISACTTSAKEQWHMPSY
jgi:hypothetical protein